MMNSLEETVDTGFFKNFNNDSFRKLFYPVLFLLTFAAATATMPAFNQLYQKYLKKENATTIAYQTAIAPLDISQLPAKQTTLKIQGVQGLEKNIELTYSQVYSDLKYSFIVLCKKEMCVAKGPLSVEKPAIPLSRFLNYLSQKSILPEYKTIIFSSDNGNPSSISKYVVYVPKEEVGNAFLTFDQKDIKYGNIAGLFVSSDARINIKGINEISFSNELIPLSSNYAFKDSHYFDESKSK